MNFRQLIIIALVLTMQSSLAQSFESLQGMTIPEGKALVYVYAKDKKAAPVFCDGTSIGTLTKKKFLYSLVDSGHHVMSNSAKILPLDFDAAPGQVYYVNRPSKDSPLALVADPVEAKRDLADYTLSGTVATNYASASGKSPVYRQGFLDAETHYNKTTGVLIGNTLATGLTSPIVGLIPALIMSGKKPATANLGVPDPAKLGDDEYMKGYRESARMKKKQAVWNGYLFGVSIWAIILAAVL